MMEKRWQFVASMVGVALGSVITAITTDIPLINDTTLPLIVVFWFYWGIKAIEVRDE